MNNKFNSELQYNRCTSRGICSINPVTSSLQEVIIIYLKIAAYYWLKMTEHDVADKRIQNLIFNTISILSSSYEISENNFNIVNSAFQDELPRIISDYMNLCKKKNIEPEILEQGLLFDEKKSINEYIRFGEKEFNNRTQSISIEIRNLFRILFIIVKSICINILTYESYGITPDEAIKLLFETLNLLNNSQSDLQDLKKQIVDIAKIDCELMNKIRTQRIKSYGEPSEQKVSFSSSKGKCALVVGNNLKELEQILDKFAGTNIDVYTHDNMILAHIFPKFREYKNLKGHYGQGMENCLLDFSTFPGPIILTRNSLYNIENLYRGRLYTTDFAYSKGVIKIRNDDFTDVIEAAKLSKGFKTGKICKSEKLGFSYKEAENKIQQSINQNKYKNIIFIGLEGGLNEEKEYFQSLFKHVPKDTLIITLMCSEIKRDNILYYNPASDISALLYLMEYIMKITNQKISFLLPYVDRHTISAIINISSLKNADVYVSRWNQAILNPNIIKSLNQEFGVKEMTTPKKDLLQILGK